MQITSVTLRNVRRFVEPVTISGIGPGLNVLSAPNEAGKSTFFDALHAVFFFSHRSFDKKIKPLVPRVGGDPEVTVDFQAEGAAWRLTKCWSGSASRKSAKLWRGGTLVGQGEEAETRLASLIGAPGDGGPAGLLWVRQGLVEMGAEAGEDAARRSILESVAGEVEAMTGGQRMKTALAACDDILGRHLTSTGRDKTGGGLATARGEVEALSAEKDALSARVTALAEDLDRRRRARRELAELSDTALAEEQAARLQAAEAALARAKEQGNKVELAQVRMRELDGKAEALDHKVATLGAALTEAGEAEQAVAAARAADAEATDRLSKAQAALDKGRAAHATARTQSEAAAAVARRVLQAETARAAQDRRAEVDARIARADALRSTIETLEARIARDLPADALRRLTAAEEALTLARHARAATAAAFTLHYDGASTPVTWDGAPVPDRIAQPVPDGAVLIIDGVGRLEITPGAGGSDNDVQSAEAALARALSQAGLPDMQAARASAANRETLQAELRGAQADLKALAPDGLSALRKALADLPAPTALDPDLPPLSEAEANEKRTGDALQQATEALRAAETLHEAARAQAAKSTRARDLAEARAARAAEALPEAPENVLATLTAERAALETTRAQARADLDALQADAPDLAASQTAVTRARSVIENRQKDIGRLREELAVLDTRIGVTASEAPEEELALVSDRLDAATARLAAISFEVSVNLRLRDALEAAQAQAREAYVKPIHAELVPLLRMLWPDAEPVIDAETGMITAISRRDVEEDFAVLSGGTREQISLLVRLAFANLLASRGTPAPVILDDAIVYTDDDRIEQMFDALTRRAETLQVIVLSCRQRAFRALGGQALAITPAGE
ncbi:chromosome segregation protein [Marinibacterium anthonyi]|nr:chromosome segregation protein [Marinibacterium anthonyi]